MRTRKHRAEEPGTSSLAFAAFVLLHAGCDVGMEELRLDGRTLACRCPRCDETRMFRSAVGTDRE